MRAARHDELAQARETLAGIVQQIESLPQHDGEEIVEEKTERGAIAATKQALVDAGERYNAAGGQMDRATTVKQYEPEYRQHIEEHGCPFEPW